MTAEQEGTKWPNASSTKEKKTENRQSTECYHLFLYIQFIFERHKSSWHLRNVSALKLLPRRTRSLTTQAHAHTQTDRHVYMGTARKELE